MSLAGNDPKALVRLKVIVDSKTTNEREGSALQFGTWKSQFQARTTQCATGGTYRIFRL